ncbi:hypothetical protein BDR22DRAFT_623426 [Usnea florida]
MQWTALSCLPVGIACAMVFSVITRHDPKAHVACANAPYRRERRTLSEEQRQDSLAAVLCLKETPSQLGMTIPCGMNIHMMPPLSLPGTATSYMSTKKRYNNNTITEAILREVGKSQKKSGKSAYNSVDQASDGLPMGGLAADTQVFEMMNTQTELIRYR